jgi:hypothetical protein
VKSTSVVVVPSRSSGHPEIKFGELRPILMTAAKNCPSCYENPAAADTPLVINSSLRDFSWRPATIFKAENHISALELFVVLMNFATTFRAGT